MIKVVRLILGFVVGMVAITLVAETIEFLTVKLVSGESFASLSSDQEAYFAIRNQLGILLFKMVYNFVAAVVAGYLASWIARDWAKIAVILLIGLQTVSLIWAGFFSELAANGPLWMWLGLIILTPIGVYVGHLLRVGYPTQIASPSPRAFPQGGD